MIAPLPSDNGVSSGNGNLARRLGLPLLTLYGLGTTIGAGIFVLVGAVAGNAGVLAPLSFVFASLLAGSTSLSFAELASRFPRSAGEAVYVQETLGVRWLARATGFAVAAAGVISSATITVGFVGYAQSVVALPGWLIATGVLFLLFLVSAWGIRESVTIASLLSVVEVGSLVLIASAGLPMLSGARDTAVFSVNAATTGTWSGVFSGAVLAFYAFVGFEDMVNVAEEVRDVERVMPRAIILTLVITLILYVSVAWVAVAALPIDQLAQSKAPLADVFEAVTGLDGRIISVVVLFAVINGVLIQIIMASRVLYGMAAQGWFFKIFGRVSRYSRVPVNALGLVTLLILAGALLFPLESLARFVSSLILMVFALINFGLMRFPKAGKSAPPHFTTPRWICGFGLLGSLGLLGFQLFELFG